MNRRVVGRISQRQHLDDQVNMAVYGLHSTRLNKLHLLILSRLHSNFLHTYGIFFISHRVFVFHVQMSLLRQPT